MKIDVDIKAAAIWRRQTLILTPADLNRHGYMIRESKHQSAYLESITHLQRK